MTERELSIIKALGEEFSVVLADLQRTFEEKLASLSAVQKKCVTADNMRPVLQAMVDEAMGGIPVPRDGRDYDPDVLQKAVDDAVGKIPVPADGKSITPDDVRPMIEQMVSEAVGRIPVPRDGRDYDPDVLQKAVNDAVGKIPVPADGKSITPDDVRPMIEQMVSEAVGRIPVPRDGRDYDPDVLQKAVNDAVGKIPVPADGKSITPDDVRPMIEQMVSEAVGRIPVPRDGRDYDPDVLQKAVDDAVSRLPVPQDGRDATALEILPGIDEQKHYPRGTYATHNGGLWRAYEKTCGMRGWECLVDGVAGVDIQQDGARCFTVTLTRSGGERNVKSFSIPVMLYRGVFSYGTEYHPGDTVTWGGSLWHCNELTTDKPGETGATGWTLAVKKGRDLRG